MSSTVDNPLEHSGIVPPVPQTRGDTEGVSQATLFDPEAQAFAVAGNVKSEKFDSKLVSSLEEDDPKRMAIAKKWLVVLVITSASCE